MTRSFIQDEYNKFCEGKLMFELIFPDTFKWLWFNEYLKPTKSEVYLAIMAVSEYRQEVQRRYYMGKDKPLRDVLFAPVRTPVDRQRENSYRRMLVKKLLVYRWYEQKKNQGVQKLFLELSKTA
jgi:hypothetical protein